MPAGATSVQMGRLCGLAGALSEYRHDLILMEPDTPARWLDNDSGERLRYPGLLLLHREIGLVPFLG